MKKRFTEAQIVGFLREADAGIPVKDLCRKHGFSDASYYLWRSKFGGMSVSDAKRLKELETENSRLKKLLADSLLENEVTREVLVKKNGDRTSSTRGGAGDGHARLERAPGVDRRAHERGCGVRAGADRNAASARIVALAHRHRRYGAGMIYLKLRQAGVVANHKRVDRLYAEARLQVSAGDGRRCRSPIASRSSAQGERVWSADFVFDRTAEGRVLKCLTIVDDATTEAVAVVPARALAACRSRGSWIGWRSSAACRRARRQRPGVLRARR